MHFSAGKGDPSMGFVLWEVKGFSAEHNTPAVISIQKSHCFQKIFEELVWKLLCFVSIPAEAFPKHSSGHLQEFENQTQAVLLPEIPNLSHIPWVSEACSPVLQHIWS